MPGPGVLHRLSSIDSGTVRELIKCIFGEVKSSAGMVDCCDDDKHACLDVGDFPARAAVRRAASSLQMSTDIREGGELVEYRKGKIKARACDVIYALVGVVVDDVVRRLLDVSHGCRMGPSARMKTMYVGDGQGHDQRIRERKKRMKPRNGGGRPRGDRLRLKQIDVRTGVVT